MSYPIHRILLAILGFSLELPATMAARVDFNREIRPILSEHCFHCHGQDSAQRKAGLRLDTFDGATAKRKAIPAITPGRPLDSELIHRVSSTDPKHRMPPADAQRDLNSNQVALLRRWIEDGAHYEKHWAFIPPRRHGVSHVSASIDTLVHSRLSREGLDFSPPAHPSTWLRRVALDLTGLPPTPAEIDAFLEDHRVRGEAAWERAVDRLLASPRFGERMAIDWLDAARYADTHGFNNDSARSMWRWRDWVIHAFNSNLPYDQFITEQLAGDLLPDASLNQRIATGFNRNHVINSEGGIIDEEYRVEYVADRVRTVSTAWLGLTFECARCHDHKYDPISQKDYYGLFAFFNNVPEHGEDGRVANAVPILPAPTEQQQRELERQESELRILDAQLSRQRQRARLTTLLRTEWTFHEPTPRPAPALPSIANGGEGGRRPGEEATWFMAPIHVHSLEVFAPHEPTHLPSPALPSIANGGEGGRRPGEEATRFIAPIHVHSLEVRPPHVPSIPTPGTNSLPLYLDFDRLNPTNPAVSFPSGKPVLVEGISGQAWQSIRAPLAQIAKGIIDFSKLITISFWIRPNSTNPRDTALFSNVTYSGNPAQQGFGKGQELRLIDGELEVRWSDFFPAYALRVRSEGIQIVPDQWTHVAVSFGGNRSASDVRLFLNGEEIPTRILYDGLTSKSAPSTSYDLGSDRTPGSDPFQGAIDELLILGGSFKQGDLRQLYLHHALPWARQRAQARVLDPLEKEQILEILLRAVPGEFSRLWETRSARWERYLALRRTRPQTMVLQELPQPRTTFLLRRGAYDARGDKIEPGVPESTIARWPEDAPRNRLGLAQWLTQPDHPLAARVIVNRFWTQLFGTGLVKTLEDFGSQGEFPSHPELLDELARGFVDNGWNVKALLRSIVLSRTYRQSSSASREAIARDPENRLLARAPRLRLPAEILRDQALSLSGLIQEQLGGESVFPYQPEGLYKDIVVGADYPGTKWVLSKGGQIYRRSLYTFWKRTLPHPAMLTLDAPDREFCTVRRSRTNTPLQALILMNEPLFVEAARKLGERIESEGGPDVESKLRWAFRLATSREPSASELAELRLSLTTQNGIPNPGAYANVASILFNLDETITRE